MPPEVVQNFDPLVTSPIIHSIEPQDKSPDGHNHDDAEVPKPLLNSRSEATSETATNVSVKPAPKILYRYIIKDDDTIISKEESDKPIQSIDDKTEVTAAAKQTLLEVVTIRKTEPNHAGGKKTTTNTTLKIHSLYLINALRELISYYPGLNLGRVPLEMNAPYIPLIHYADALKNYKTNHPENHSAEMIATTNDHIDTLLALLTVLNEKEVEVERERHQRNPPVCTWDYAWMLFPPGTLVWLRERNGDMRAAIICYMYTRFMYFWDIRYKSYMEFTAHVEGCMLERFEGEREISQLEVCPQKWAKVSPEIIHKQIKRGKMYTELFKPCYMEYSSQAINESGIQIQGKVMVDHNSWYNHVYNDPEDDMTRTHKIEMRQFPDLGCECNSCSLIMKPKRIVPARDWPHDPANKESLDLSLPEEFYLLCHSVIGGYALHERKWVSLHLDGIIDPVIEDSPFDNLVLDQETKSTIEALVWNYVQEGTKVQSWSTDFVKNKGEGRIFLLHGSPGVGKTCTAECVADLVRRPLLSLTCGDMGITAEEVESNFKEFIDLGERWGAVVLMDEADVYLEQRTSENLQRNSLVSVFLRTLEYFRGVLFLTTNRVGAFDDAFISRIHVALHYQPLSDDYRKKIWEKNFRRLTKEGNITIDPATVIYAVSDPDVIAVKWNGREIRNAFQTAVALAQFEARKAGRDEVVLEVEHLKRVVTMSKHFKDYITSTHMNQDETKRARIQERRNDEFTKK